MRKFTSYGPVDRERHFCLDRKELIEQCTNLLTGDIEKEGHFFTIWAPRQTGKTWLRNQVINVIKTRHKDRFIVGSLSMQGFQADPEDDAKEIFFIRWHNAMQDEFDIDTGILKSWEDWMGLFSKMRGVFDRPVILLIDEFDKLPNDIIDRIVSMFREMYLERENYLLHGLALIGVRSVLGVESDTGSPFNVQRSLHIPNFTPEDVKVLYNQYQEESGQKIDLSVVDEIFEVTSGQPGLVGWLGELLTQTYNPGNNKAITTEVWNTVRQKAMFKEPNNTLINLISRKPEYRKFLIKLYSDSNIPFSFHNTKQNYLYMHGIISSTSGRDQRGMEREIACFSSPFIQECLYHAFCDDFSESLENENNSVVLALEPMDSLDDVFEDDQKGLNLPALLRRYTGYLSRLKDKGINPWKNQPRRKTDLHLTEAVGHFHLYYWLQMALGMRCSISPEFPTGNGKVDLHLTCGNKKGIIEVKSYSNAYEAGEAVKQAAKYALKTKHQGVTIAMFVPFTDEDVLKQISVKKKIKGVDVTVVAIGQG